MLRNRPEFCVKSKFQPTAIVKLWSSFAAGDGSTCQIHESREGPQCDRNIVLQKDSCTWRWFHVTVFLVKVHSAVGRLSECFRHCNLVENVRHVLKTDLTGPGVFHLSSIMVMVLWGERPSRWMCDWPWKPPMSWTFSATTRHCEATWWKAAVVVVQAVVAVVLFPVSMFVTNFCAFQELALALG